jgi:hypothetical protein
MYWEDFKPVWKGQTVAVLGSGPTMSKKVADSVKHLPRIVLNTTYQLAPDADYIYAADPPWWHRFPEVFACPGLKVSAQASTQIHPNTPEKVLILRNGGRYGFDDRPGYIRTGPMGGYAALHLAASLGATQILLHGFDCHGGHWHGPHPDGLGNPLEQTYRGWIRALENLAPMLKQRGVEVINCTPNSRLSEKCFRYEMAMAA